MNIVTYKCEKSKITQKLDDSMCMLTHKICICRLRKTGRLLIFPLYIMFIAFFLNIEHQY